MAETLSTDVFKFVAVRPVQKATDRETRRTIVRDERRKTPDGIRKLERLARDLAPAGAALARWGNLDLTPLQPLGEGYPDVVRHYEAGDPETGPTAGIEVLKAAGITLPADGDYSRLLELAWDALYIADRTGPDAGPRLELPMAALRVLHFAALLGEEPKPAAADALPALRAMPSIPGAVHQARQRPTPQAPEREPQESPGPDASRRSSELRRLAQELVTAEGLLEAVSNPLGFSRPTVTVAEEREGALTRTHVRVDTAPSFRDALAAEISPVQASLLRRARVTEDTSAPVAAQMLHGQLSALTEQAFMLGGDPEFQGYVREQKLLKAGFDLAHEVGSAIGVTGGWSSYLADEVGSAPEVNVSGRITPLGIGDLKVVKQTLLAYVPGEVAHIENVLRGESKNRHHRKLDRTETTVFTSEEETEDTQRDTQSTERFELKREAEQTIKEDMSIKAGLNVTAAFGPVVTTATGDFAYATSKEDSQKSSSNFAREVVDRSVSKIQKKTKAERTVKTVGEVEEINSHGLDNTSPGTDHIVGVYRWVDKRYRAQVYNYGVRLLLEFVVPEPAAFYSAAQIGRALKNLDARRPEPFVNLAGAPLQPTDLNDSTYLKYGAVYGAAGLTPPPAEYTYVGTTLAKENIKAGESIAVTSKDLVVPEGYLLWDYRAIVSILWVGGPKFSLQVGGRQVVILDDPNPSAIARIKNATDDLAPGVTEPVPAGPVPLSVGAYDVVAFAVNIHAICFRTPARYEKWQLETFDKIYAAYLALEKEYQQKVAQAKAAVGIMIEGRNPAANRVIERNELKKLCITMMTGQHFKQFNSMTDPPDKPAHYPEIMINDALGEGRIIQFFEQAFEWEQMTYVYYPYFWGRKKNWVEVNRITDPDPMFEQFRTAGAARVVVPVPMAYVKAVQYLLQQDVPLSQKVWGGGDRPTLDDPLYESIAQEMKDRTDDLDGARPEGDPWEFTLPTTLVWLQPDSTLPSFS